MLLPPKPAREGAPVPELVSDHFVQGEGYGVSRGKGTTTALLFFTRRGEGFMRAVRAGREHAHITRAGEFVLWQPGAAQDYGTVPASVWDFHWVHFHAKNHWKPLLQMSPVSGVKGLSTLKVEASNIPAMDALFTSIHRDTRLSSHLRSELAMNALERILLLAQESHGTRTARAIDARVRVAMEAIAADPAKRHSVTALAKLTNLSPSRFAHLFTHETGSSVLDTVIRTRLAQAERLLVFSASGIGEIAFAVGFSSVSLFTRHFTRRYGVSPRQFRERHLGHRS